MKNKTLWLMCGVPGSGKSYWLKDFHVLIGGTIVSRDAIRFKLLGDDVDASKYFDHEDEVWDIFIKQTKEAIRTSSNIFVDATHLSQGSRNKLLNALNLDNKTLINIVYFDVPLEVCLARNDQREGWAHVPKSVIRRMYVQMVKPNFHEKYTYHRIYTIDENGCAIKTESPQGIIWEPSLKE